MGVQRRQIVVTADGLAVDEDLRHRGDMGALDHLALPDFILGDVDILETGAFFSSNAKAARL